MLPGRPGPGIEERRRLIEAARGRLAPDLVVTGGTLANVYSGEWLPWNVEILDGRVAYTGPRKPEVGRETRVVDATGRVVAPAYIEPHSHPWALYNPVSLLERALPSGTVTLVADNLAFFLQLGAAGFHRIVRALEDVPAHLLWVARVVSQSTFPGEAELFSADAVREQLEWPEVVMAGEVTRWADISAGDEHILGAFATALRLGKRVDGHTAGASFERLGSLVAAGVSADHEAITGEQALDRLRLGLWTMLRDSSLRRDLPELLSTLLAAGADTRRLLLTTDGSGPAHYDERGLVDDLLTQATGLGLSSMAALQLVTINAATFLGIDEELGGLAPGRRASFVVLPDRDTFRPDEVYVNGRLVAERGELAVVLPAVDWAALGCRPQLAPPERWLDPAIYVTPARGAVPVMAYESTVISRRVDRELPARDGLVDLSGEPDLAYAALVSRDARLACRGVVSGLFPRLGGLASTYNTTGQLLVLGRDPASMAAAAAEVARLGGGVAFAEAGAVSWSAALDVVGFATSAPYATAVAIERELRQRSAAAGYPFHDPVYTLLFLPCDFLPDLRLTLDGLLEVKSGRILEPAAVLG
jgi:adenine deaminase